VAWSLTQRRTDLSQTGRVASRWGPGERRQATHGSTGRHLGILRYLTRWLRYPMLSIDQVLLD
jgi:hypothetical protein